MADKVSSLEDVASDPSIRRIADVFHYLVVDARIKQYYYELKYVRDGSKLLELVGKALRDIDTLRSDEEEAEKISELKLPDKDDLQKLLVYYNQFKVELLRLLIGFIMAAPNFRKRS